MYPTTNPSVDYREFPDRRRQLPSTQELDGRAVALLKRFTEREPRHVHWSLHYNHYSTKPERYRVEMYVDHRRVAVAVDESFAAAAAKCVQIAAVATG
jgi:hypothetical protein